MKVIDLNGAWSGKCVSSEESKNFPFEATVPGSTVNDLIRAGKLPSDIFYGKNSDSVKEYENCSYVYTKKFDCGDVAAKAELSFERLDTYCDVYLNGVHLGHRENGNMRHTFDVSGALKAGENIIEIYFYSPITSVAGKKHRNGAFTQERLNTRRMQCTYGWDWVDRFISCGISGASITLTDADEVYPKSVYIYTKAVDEESASVGVDVNLDKGYKGRLFGFEFIAPDGSVKLVKTKYCEEDFVRLTVDIEYAQLWYPVGYGDQPLYTFKMYDGGKEIHSEKFGIRTVKIQQIPDLPNSANARKCRAIHNELYDSNEEFSGFILKVNGVKIMCKGANWVPCEPFENGQTEAKITEILELAVEMGVNMIRVWGGGAFEKKHFYDECSRLGITVTQDFLMACGTYPEDEEWFINALKLEAEYAALSLRNQPCLMWWTGDNENAVNGCDTDVTYSGRRSAYKGLAPVVYKLDPYREFLPSSPYGGKKYASNTVGTTHNTQFLGWLFDFFDKDDVSEYKKEMKRYNARFIAEQPQMGAASLPSLKKFMTDEEIFGTDEDMWLFHTKSNPCLKRELFDYFATIAKKLLGDFTDGYDKFFKYKYVQYEWIRVAMEQARREKWFCSGIIFWMLNDCWPASSGWSLIDYYNVPKDAFYAFKRCAKPVLATFDCADGAYTLSVVNDTVNPVKVKAAVKIISADRLSCKEICKAEAVVGGGESKVVYTFGAKLSNDEILVADVESDLNNDRAFYVNGTLPITPAEVKTAVDESALTVTVRSSDYVHAVELEGNAVFEDSCFSLLPNETRTVKFRKLGGYFGVKVTAYTL